MNGQLLKVELSARRLIWREAWLSMVTKHVIKFEFYSTLECLDVKVSKHYKCSRLGSDIKSGKVIVSVFMERLCHISCCWLHPKKALQKMVHLLRTSDIKKLATLFNFPLHKSGTLTKIPSPIWLYNSTRSHKNSTNILHFLCLSWNLEKNHSVLFYTGVEILFPIFASKLVIPGFEPKGYEYYSFSRVGVNSNLTRSSLPAS